MVQPKTPPISLRIPPNLLRVADDWARLHNCSRHAALIRLIGIGVGGEAGLMMAYFAEKKAELDAAKKAGAKAAKPAPSAHGEVRIVPCVSAKETAPKPKPHVSRLKGEWKPR